MPPSMRNHTTSKATHSDRHGYAYSVGIYVPFAQLNPRFGFRSASASMQMTVGCAIVCGNMLMLLSLKFWHELFVLHSMMIASVCVRFGSPALYQQGSDAQLPSPGWKVLIVPVQAHHECDTTDAYIHGTHP